MSAADHRAARKKYGPDAVLRRRLARHSDPSCIVSYVRDDGLAATLIGCGDSMNARVADADAQLPPGEWKRCCVSTPTSIYADLQGRAIRDTFTSGVTERVTAYPAYEGKMVSA